MLSAKKISFGYKHHRLLNEISFEANAGEFIAILGPNGAGKSTLLSYISNELDHKNKAVLFKNKPISQWNISELPMHKAKFSQHQASDITLSIKDVVMMGRYPYFNQTPSATDEAAVDSWMKTTDTYHLKNRTYEHLSGGEKQRIHLARVLTQLENEHRQKLILLDEPLNNLDVSHQFRTLEIIKNLTKKQNTAIVVLHDINLAAQFADKILLLKKGCLVAYDTPENVLTQQLVSDTYNFPCIVTQNPINKQPLILFGLNLNDMNTLSTLKEQWTALKAERPHLRIRNAAEELGVSEAELLATQTGDNVTRLRPEFQNILKEIETLGKVMALTRNNECVHERKGVYLNADFSSPHAGLFVGEDIDMRIFWSHWAKAYAVVDETARGTMKSIQFFGKDGEAIHKIYVTKDSNDAAFDALVAKYKAEDQTTDESVEKTTIIIDEKPDSEIDVEGFQQAWLSLKDTHDFFMMLHKFGVTRTQALRLAPDEFHAKPIEKEAIVTMLEAAAEQKLPIMVFTGNKGNIQIHTGLVRKTMWHENWYNVMDPDFNMHLDMSKIAQTWIVRKPTEDGIVTAIEVFNEMGDIIVQFFGKRKPGIPELEEWRTIVSKLS